MSGWIHIEDYNIDIIWRLYMSKEYKGNLLTKTDAPSGNMLFGDKTKKERKDENRRYKQNKLNEG